MWLKALSMFHRSEREEKRSSANPITPSVLTLALLVKSASEPAIAAAAPVVAAAFAALVAVTAREAALGLLQIGTRPLPVQIVLLQVVLGLRPDRDALVELHHQEPHRFPLGPLEQLGHFRMAGDED